MNVRYKAHVKQASLLLCLLALTLFLVACGYTGGTTTVEPTPTPTPTPAGLAYAGTGYTLTYPQDWTYKTQEPLGVVFTSKSDPYTTCTITVTPALPTTNLDTQLTAALKLFSPNYKPDNTVPSTISVGGDTWKQAGATSTENGQSIKGTALADQHPAGTGKIYVITLKAKADSYDQVYSTSFKPLLDSFKFS